MIYKRAIDYAVQNGDDEIIELLLANTEGNTEQKKLIIENLSLKFIIESFWPTLSDNSPYISKSSTNSTNESEHETKQLETEIQNLKLQISNQIRINEDLNRQKIEKNSIIESIKLSSETVDFIEKVRTIHKRNEIGTSEVKIKKRYILKEINEIDENKIQILIQEQERLNNQRHPNILDIKKVYINEERTMISILMERCPFNLTEALKNKKFNKVEASFVIYQIAEGMKFIHLYNIAHNGLKPSNILIDSDGRIKISDIGHILLRKKGIEFNNNYNIGSLFFMAPEMKKNENINEKVDVYSFGAIVYFIVNFGDFPKLSLRELIEGKQLEAPSTFTDNAKEIIDYCCNENPQNRPNFNQIVEYLNNDECQLFEFNKQEHNEYQRLIKEHQKLIH